MPSKKAKQQYTEGEPSSDLVSKGHPCTNPKCGSSDAVALYSDGHGHCFSCGVHLPAYGEGSPQVAGGRAGGDTAGPTRDDPEALLAVLKSGSHRSIKTRHLTQETCKVLDIRVRQTNRGEWEQIYPYRNADGHLEALKIRNTGTDGTDKLFRMEGNTDALWLMHKWPKGGKRLVIVGGEIDAATVSQCYSHKWPVVSPPKGEPSLSKYLKKNLDWVLSFDEVCLGMDMDPAGRAASLEAAKLLPPGKAKIIKWGRKDPNEMLQHGEGEQITLNVWNAEAYQPDGIVDARSLTAECLAAPVFGTPWFSPELTAFTYGKRDGEMYTLGSGTGMGKSDLMAEELAATLRGSDGGDLRWPAEACAVFGFEAKAAQIKKQIAGKLWSRRFHLPPEDNGVGWTEAELRDALAYMDEELWRRGGRLFLNDNFGAADWESIKDRARWMVHANGVKHILVDPVGALVAASDDERKDLDRIFLEGSMLAQELSCKVYMVSHLTRPSLGPSHEEGGQVRLNQFRGSNAIGMYSTFVMGWEGNQQAETEEERAKRTLRMLKDRLSGNSTGKTLGFCYNALNGRLERSTPLPTIVGEYPEC